MTDNEIVYDDLIIDDDFYCEGDISLVLSCANCGSEISSMDDKCNNCGMIFDIDVDDDYIL